MARFVATPEKIEEINKLYYQLGVKKKVAEVMGCSPSTVSKYIKVGWKPPEEMPEVDLNTLAKPEGPFDFILKLSEADYMSEAFCQACILDEKEWQGMKQVQEEYVNI